MPAYDSALFVPAAPLARVTLRNPESEALQEDVPMLLDTGADVTLLPHAAIKGLGVTTLNDKHYELVDFEGHVSLSSIVRVEMIFLGHTFRGQFLLLELRVGHHRAQRLKLYGSDIRWPAIAMGEA